MKTSLIEKFCLYNLVKIAEGNLNSIISPNVENGDIGIKEMSEHIKLLSNGNQSEDSDNRRNNNSNNKRRM